MKKKKNECVTDFRERGPFCPPPPPLHPLKVESLGEIIVLTNKAMVKQNNDISIAILMFLYRL